MKAKHILIIAIVFLLVLIGFMTKDLFYSKGPNPNNPYEYDLSAFKKVDSSLMCYAEVQQLNIETEILYGLTIHSNDYLYVSGKSSLFVFNPEWEFVKEIELGGDAYCLTISDDGNIYLGMTDHVEIWSPEGELLQTWESKGGQAIFTSIALTDQSVYVADAGNKLVYHYDHSGQILNTIGKRDVENGKLGFILPSPYFDLLTGRNDELWVVNPGMHQFESYRSDGSLISSWKKTSMQLDGFSGCCNPTHIAMLSDGSFVTSEKGIERVKIHHPNGDFKCVVASPDQFIEGTTDLDIAVDSKDRIYISDPKQGMIRIFEKKIK